MKLVLLLCVLASGAARAVPAVLEVVPLVLAEVALAADALQTMDIKRHPEMRESNPILGHHPSDAKVVGYFVGAGLLTGIAWCALPRGWRVLVPIAVVALQIGQIERNARLGFTIRF